jgi:hypothetical protein
MIRLTTLFFPDTVMEPSMRNRLLLFFEKVYHYLPAEEETTTAADPHCQGYAPVPLGDDLGNFQRTIKDILTNVYDYGQRLRLLSLASMVSGPEFEGDENSVSSLAAAIRTSGPRGFDRPSESEKLWRARLVLKLAERLDRDQENIDNQLLQLTRSHQAMLARLRGTEGEMLEHTDLLSAPKDEWPQPGRDIFLRMRAWTHLYLADPAPLSSQTVPILTTQHQAAIDQLSATYGKHFNRQPEVLLSIPLPDPRHTAEEDLRSRLNDFRAETADILMNASTVLNRTAAGEMPCQEGRRLPLFDHEKKTAWRSALERFFPAAANGPGRLTIYCLERVSPAAILSKTFMTDGPVHSIPDRSPTALIAHLLL